jgi:hypothetical protein
MMEWTDSHCRVFHRLMTRHALLYTEMVTTGALIHGDVPRHLRFNAEEHPVALQLGGSEPADLVAECLAVAQAEGVAVPGDMGAACRKLIEAMPGQYSSTAQDLARHKPTEIDYLNGLIVRRGEALGIATPANNAMCALVKLLETKRA